MRIRRPRRPRQFRLADSAQQIVGGFLLAGPFVVTEEVWTLAGSMNGWQTLGIVIVVFGIGYGALYAADTTRDVEEEQEVAGIPLRFISLMVVSFGSVTLLALLLDAPDAFLDDGESTRTVVETTFTAVSIGSVFSVVGAATADSLFSKPDTNNGNGDGNGD
ncbi:DUF2391 family protein [Halopiger xanaduensis]|uniref:Membrane protein-like protein n=1 Tax=Halopiger xanaduensis (strain DSM 18323 / JCM 14033 / SH-6) TaxID=797210 RepID=F8D8N5_HALXS|nr:DUF2391 family protein [Halopiger xanaduensis]AEH36787.1 membrane protein-like protein [Halopiger xanaduensis SH-6]